MFDEDDQNLGYHRPNYAAQTMFSAYRSGMDFSGLGHDGLGFVSDMNKEEDQSFDPNALSHLNGDMSHMSGHMNGMPDFGAVGPVAQPSMTTARRNEEDRSGNQPVAPETKEASSSAFGWGEVIAGGATMVLGVVGSIVQSSAAKKSAEQQMALNKTQTEANLAEAERLRAQAEVDRANSLPWGTIIAGGTVVMAVGLTAMLIRDRKRSSV